MIELSPIEARIIGVLLEKERTTPDYYPMTINALTNACNQKNCRLPVTAFHADEVTASVQALEERGLVANWVAGQRTPKYKHRFCNTEFSELKFSDEELAIVCELLLRGAQTAQELKSRASRISPITDANQAEQVLRSLEARSLVTNVGRIHGKRDTHYIHNFSENSSLDHASIAAQTTQPENVSVLAQATLTEKQNPSLNPSPETNSNSNTKNHPSRIDQLEDKVKTLEKEVDELKELINTLL